MNPDQVPDEVRSKAKDAVKDLVYSPNLPDGPYDLYRVALAAVLEEETVWERPVDSTIPKYHVDDKGAYWMDGTRFDLDDSFFEALGWMKKTRLVTEWRYV